MNSDTCIEDLPAELLHDILSISFSKSCQEHQQYRYSRISPVAEVLRFSLVSRRWRNICVTSSHFWSYVHTPSPVLADIQIRRSCSQGLYVHIGSETKRFMTDWIDVLEVLSLHCERWKSLSLTLDAVQRNSNALNAIHGRLHLLKEINIVKYSPPTSEHFSALSSAPSLKKITLNEFSGHIDLPFENVADLTINSVSLEDLAQFRIFHRLESVTNLTLDNVSSEQEFNHTVVVLPRLREVVFKANASKWILRMFRAPVLNRLYLSRAGVNQLPSFIEKSGAGASLQYIHINMPLSDTILLRILKEVPHLKEIILEGWAGQSLSPRTLRALTSRSGEETFVPRLEKFKVLSYLDYADLGTYSTLQRAFPKSWALSILDLIDMLEARAAASMKHIEFVGKTLRDSVFCGRIEPDAQRRLQALRRDGLDIRFYVFGEDIAQPNAAQWSLLWERRTRGGKSGA